MIEKLGVDIGRVIIDRPRDAPRAQTGDALLADVVPDAIISLHRLATERFHDRIFLVSKCGARRQEETLLWLIKSRFYDLTGIWPSHTYFCRQRHEKADICRNLGITHFVDDRL
ncbi:MAG: hypothetical protein AAB731_04735, partial [Patescibacteria group bacterium]